MRALCDSHFCVMKALCDSHLCVMKALYDSHLCTIVRHAGALCSNLRAMQSLYNSRLCTTRDGRKEWLWWGNPLCGVLPCRD